MAVGMDIGAFASDWAYCDRLSSYIAKMVSHNRTDSLLYSNLLSSALNELLETAHRAHGASGKFVCSILRHGNKDRVELVIPNDLAGSDFYRTAVSRLSQENLAETYRTALFQEGSIDPTIGLMELAVDYNARLTIEPMDDGAVRLTADLTLEN
ncbi:ubiquinone biosynthesis methyltransferase UbiE [Mesorhizobium sp. 1B3]|uniref:ubiquinone biosynthesis methyltransferase UbiE n=1 Tax=Mesorhizobium sp. 1B3 TaxID=3243599 RepID=UPI003D9824CF